MTDRKGDKSKQPESCDEFKCPNMGQSYQGYDKESYRCETCGASYNLYYEDMT